jgi:hypothetical protein
MYVQQIVKRKKYMTKAKVLRKRPRALQLIQILTRKEKKKNEQIVR